MNVVNLVRSAIIEASDAKAFTLLVDGETQEVSITFAELDRQAKQIAVGLQRLGLQGERVLLVYPFGIDHFTAMLGCVYAGAVVVLAFPPMPNRPLTPLESMASDAQAKVVLTSQAILGALHGAVQGYPVLKGLHWLAIESFIAEEDPGLWKDPMLVEDDPVILSYTSGSTSTPRGVLLTHQNLCEGIRRTKDLFQFTPGEVGVVCTPLNHVLSCLLVLAALYGQTHVVLVPTQLVLERPFRWLQAISHYRAACSGGFSFLFQLSLQHITPAERDTLDLSCLKWLGTGGERIDGLLLEGFTDYFRPAGLREGLFCIRYGLTESVSIATVSIGFHHQLFDQQQLQHNQAVVADVGTKGVVDLVSCGKPEVGKILIVDPETCVLCPEHHVGEVWLQGPHVAVGYWQHPEINKETFHAFLRDTGESPFLRTGDLGFISDGDLYIAGRLKDIIILRGQNYFSPEFEQAVAGTHPAMVLGGTAAVGWQMDGEERLALVQEVLPGTDAGDYLNIIQAIRERITAAFEQPVYAVVLVEQGQLPRTGSRKIARYRCLQGFQDGSLKPLKVDILSSALDRAGARKKDPRSPRTPIEGALLGIWMGVLKADGMIGVDDNFFTIGGDSIDAALIVAHIQDVFQVSLPMQVFFESPTIAGMAQAIEKTRLSHSE